MPRYARPTALRTPRSPATTRGRPNVRARIHSAVQTPIPRSATSAAITSSSGPRREGLAIEPAARYFGCDLDDRSRLGGRELERPQRLDGGLGESLRREAVDVLAVDDVAIAERLGKASAGRRRPREVHLLGADRPDERGEEVRLEDRPEPGVLPVKGGQHRIGREQGGPVGRRGHERPADGLRHGHEARHRTGRPSGTLDHDRERRCLESCRRSQPGRPSCGRRFAPFARAAGRPIGRSGRRRIAGTARGTRQGRAGLEDRQ